MAFVGGGVGEMGLLIAYSLPFLSEDPFQILSFPGACLLALKAADLGISGAFFI